MSKVKIDIGAKVKKTSVMTVESEPLVVDLAVPPTVVAEAMAKDLKKQVESQPSDKWDKTGTLKNGLRAEADGVHVPNDRLNRPELRERFRAEVMAPNPLNSRTVDKAIGELLTKMLGGR